MKRRNFIILSGGMVVAFAIPTCYYFFKKIRYPAALSHPSSLASILDPEELRELGSAYRKQVPDESAERVLANRLQDVLPEHAELGAALESQIRRDFEKGNTVE